MEAEPVVVEEDERGWERMQGEEAGGPAAVSYKTLISGNLTRSEALTMGVAKIPPGAALSEHRHRQAEVYLVFAGGGSVRIGAGVRGPSGRARRSSCRATSSIRARTPAHPS